MDFKNEFQATRIIRTEGMGGANKAAMLVSLSTVIALLVYQYKEEGADDEEILELFKNTGLTRFAEISYSRCVIWEDGSVRPTAAFEIKRKAAGETSCASIPIEGLNVPMWMGGVQQHLFAGNPPYAEIQKILLERYREFNIKHGLPHT